MNISEFSFHLVLIFLPGIIAFLIIDNLSSHKPYKNVYIFMYVLLLGMMSYITLSILNNIITFFAPCISGLHIWENMTQPGGNLSLTEIFFAAIISVFLGCLISLINKHALFMRFALKLHLTRRHGFPDTFSYMMHLYSNAIKNYPFYLTITDWERKFRIVGQLVAIFSSCILLFTGFIQYICRVIQFINFIIIRNIGGWHYENQKRFC